MKGIVVTRIAFQLLLNRNSALVSRRKNQTQLELGETFKARHGFQSCYAVATEKDLERSSDTHTTYVVERRKPPS